MPQTSGPTNSEPDSSAERVARAELEKIAFTIALQEDLGLRNRLTTLTSLLFGLSLLALQVKNPQGVLFAITAWISLGAAVFLSVVSAVTGSLITNRVVKNAVEIWPANDKPSFRRTVRFGNIELGGLIFTLFFALLGVVFLVVFAIINVQINTGG